MLEVSSWCWLFSQQSYLLPLPEEINCVLNYWIKRKSISELIANRTYQHSRDQPFLFELMSRRRVRTRHLHYNISKGRFLLAVSILLAWHQVIYNNGGSPRMTWKCQHVGEENQTCMLGLYCRFFSTGYNSIYCIHVEIYIRVLSVGWDK